MQALRRIGRPLEGAIAEVDALLTLWGEETGGSGLPTGSTGHPIARMMRDGEYGAVQTQGPPPLSQRSEKTGIAVKLLSKRTRRVVVHWYGSSARFNRSLCLKFTGMSLTEFKWRLRAGREQVATFLHLLD